MKKGWMQIALMGAVGFGSIFLVADAMNKINASGNQQLISDANGTLLMFTIALVSYVGFTFFSEEILPRLRVNKK